MEELLKKLLEAEVLSEDTKTELEEAFQSKIDEAIEVAKAEAETTVKAELNEQWISEREALIEALDTKVTQFLNEEMNELRSDIDNFRDLEAEYAEKLVEAKASMASELQTDLAELVEKVDTFLEIRINSEISELREDLEVQKQNNFGRKIFEAIANEYRNNYADDDNLAETLSETEERLNDTTEALLEAETKLAEIERKQKLDEVLSPLSGKQREVMEAILKNVNTDQLEEGYNTFIGRVLKEDVADESEIVTESCSKDKEEMTEEDKKKKTEEMVKESTIVLGDKEPTTEEEKTLTESSKERLKKLAGIV